MDSMVRSVRFGRNNAGRSKLGSSDADRFGSQGMADSMAVSQKYMENNHISFEKMQMERFHIWI